MSVQDQIDEFSELMTREMAANDHKSARGPWIDVPPKELLADILYHAGKLAVAIKEQDAKGVEEYAADVGNLAMMTLNAYRKQNGLGTPSAGRYDLSPCGDSL